MTLAIGRFASSAHLFAKTRCETRRVSRGAHDERHLLERKLSCRNVERKLVTRIGTEELDVSHDADDLERVRCRFSPTCCAASYKTRGPRKRLPNGILEA